CRLLISCLTEVCDVICARDGCCVFVCALAAPTAFCTLSLHDALPICIEDLVGERGGAVETRPLGGGGRRTDARSRVRGADRLGPRLRLDEHAAIAWAEPRVAGVDGSAFGTAAFAH